MPKITSQDLEWERRKIRTRPNKLGMMGIVWKANVSSRRKNQRVGTIYKDGGGAIPTCVRGMNQSRRWGMNLGRD